MDELFTAVNILLRHLESETEHDYIPFNVYCTKTRLARYYYYCYRYILSLSKNIELKVTEASVATELVSKTPQLPIQSGTNVTTLQQSALNIQ